MKYIFLLTLMLATVGVGAQPVINWDDPIYTETPQDGGFGSNDTTPLGGNSNDTTQFGGASNDTTPLGGGGGTSGTSRTPQLAEIPKPNSTIAGFIEYFLKIINYIIVLLMTIALLVFLYGIVVLMFVKGAQEDSRSQGRKFMLWGIISLFVMASVWGIVNVLKTSVFGGGSLAGPQFKTQ